MDAYSALIEQLENDQASPEWLARATEAVMAAGTATGQDCLEDAFVLMANACLHLGIEHEAEFDVDNAAGRWERTCPGREEAVMVLFEIEQGLPEFRQGRDRETDAWLYGARCVLRAAMQLLNAEVA